MITKRKYPIHTKTIIVSARVPVSLLNKIDKVCSDTGRSRSDVIEQVLSDYFSSEYTDFDLKEMNFDTVE